VLLEELEEVNRLRSEFLPDLRGMGAEGRSVAALLTNKDSRRLDELYAGLPDGVARTWSSSRRLQATTG
jgi:hypothetical protein